VIKRALPLTPDQGLRPSPLRGSPRTPGTTSGEPGIAGEKGGSNPESPIGGPGVPQVVVNQPGTAAPY